MAADADVLEGVRARWYDTHPLEVVCPGGLVEGDVEAGTPLPYASVRSGKGPTPNQWFAGTTEYLDYRLVTFTVWGHTPEEVSEVLGQIGEAFVRQTWWTPNVTAFLSCLEAPQGQQLEPDKNETRHGKKVRSGTYAVEICTQRSRP